MKPLPLERRNDGFILTQVWRDERFAIYSQAKHGRVMAYELIRIGHVGDKTFPNGISTPGHEVYPSSSRWGEDGWTFGSRGAAEEFLDRLHANAISCSSSPP